MVPLVTIEEAKLHLRIIDDVHDNDITMKAEQATDIVIDYIERPDHGWTDDDAPSLIKAAILLVLGSLFEDRETGGLSEQVKGLLRRYRDPALA